MHRQKTLFSRLAGRVFLTLAAFSLDSQIRLAVLSQPWIATKQPLATCRLNGHCARIHGKHTVCIKQMMSVRIGPPPPNLPDTARRYMRIAQLAELVITITRLLVQFQLRVPKKLLTTFRQSRFASTAFGYMPIQGRGRWFESIQAREGL